MDYRIFSNKTRTESAVDKIFASYETAVRMTEVLQPTAENANKAIITWIEQNNDRSIAMAIAYMEYLEGAQISAPMINQSQYDGWIESSNSNMENINDYVEYLYIKIYEFNSKIKVPVSELIIAITEYRGDFRINLKPGLF